MIKLREMTVDDDEAYGQLARACPDGGRVSFYSDFNINAYQANQALKPNMIAVVAEHPDHKGLVGTGIVSFLDVNINGNNLPGVHLLQAQSPSVCSVTGTRHPDRSMACGKSAGVVWG